VDGQESRGEERDVRKTPRDERGNLIIRCVYVGTRTDRTGGGRCGCGSVAGRGGSRLSWF
jgi:hypothetical protein